MTGAACWPGNSTCPPATRSGSNCATRWNGPRGWCWNRRWNRWAPDASDRVEAAGFGHVLLDPALADIVPQPVQRQRAALDFLAHEGKAHQVFQRHEDRLLFQRLGARVAVLDLLHALVSRAKDVHPAADEAGLFLQLRRVARTH